MKSRLGIRPESGADRGPGTEDRRERRRATARPCWHQEMEPEGHDPEIQYWWFALAGELATGASCLLCYW